MRSALPRQRRSGFRVPGNGAERGRKGLANRRASRAAGSIQREAILWPGITRLDPGGMRTEMRAAAYPEEDPMTRITPEENTDVFLYLASDESRGVTGERFKAQEFRKA